MVLESKLDGSFPQGQFKISDSSRPFRLGRNRNGGGLCSLSTKIFQVN